MTSGAPAFVRGRRPLRAITGLTSSATAGTRTTVAHGLTDFAGRAVAPTVAIPVVTAADADGAIAAASVFVVGMTSTTVTVRASAASVPYTLYVG